MNNLKPKVMKTILRVVLVFILAAFGNSLFAAGNLKVNILPVSSEKALFSVSTLCDDNFKMTVADVNGNIVYDDENSGPAIDHLEEFNMSDLKDGKYKLTVVCGNLTSERMFNISGDGVKVGKEKTIIQPFFGYKDGILRCTYLNFPKENLKLYFLKSNQLLYSKELGKTFNVTEGINLSRLENGNYEVILSAGDREYSFRVDKE